MLVSAVVDPSAFEAGYFDELYTIQAVDFLKGIQRNGLLIVDSENRLRDVLVKQVVSLPIKPQQRLGFLIQELLLKKKSKRVIACLVSLNDTSSVSLLDLAYHLKTDTGVDALVVGKESLETLKSDRRFNERIIPLSEYRDSNFEKDREVYETRVGPIDTLPKSEVEDMLIRSIRFAKWLRFYDAYIGTGSNTSRFRNGIEYILSLWYEHGFFASQQGIGTVEIYTCSAERISKNETDHAKTSKLERNRDNYQRVIRNLIEPLKKKFPYWPVRFSVKDDPNYIFHARFLEAEHAIVQMDRGFDLFKPNGEFQRNFFTLNMAGSSHLRECRQLPNADLTGVP